MGLSKEQMLKILSEIDPFYIEMIMRVHPIFDRCLSVEEAGKELGVSGKTARKLWKEFIEKFPAVGKAMSDHVEESRKTKNSLKNTWRCGDLMTTEFSEDDSVYGDRIVEKF